MTPLAWASAGFVLGAVFGAVLMACCAAARCRDCDWLREREETHR